MADNKSPIVAHHAAMQLYSGPIPPANELKKYEEILPGAADRILTMAEEQSAHRRKMENKMLEANIKAEKIGQSLGFAIFLIALIAGIILIILNKDAIGLITSLGSLTAIVGLFVYNRISAKQELKEKNNIKSNENS